MALAIIHKWGVRTPFKLRTLYLLYFLQEIMLLLASFSSSLGVPLLGVDHLMLMCFYFMLKACFPSVVFKIRIFLFLSRF